MVRLHAYGTAQIRRDRQTEKDPVQGQIGATLLFKSGEPTMKALIVVLILLFGTSSNVEAKVKIPIPIPWGTTQKMHKIQSLEIPGVKDAYFGYVTEKTYFLYVFGLYIDTKGYAIGSGQEGDNHGEFIDQSVVNNLQTLEIIPKNLPSEPSLSFFDILSGFSFWWILGLGIGLFYFWDFFGRLSNGEFGLAETYWFYGVFVGFAVSYAMKSITSIGLIAIIMLIYAAYQILVTIGVWRAANGYEGTKVWAVLAKIAVVLGIIVLGGNLISVVALSTSSNWIAT